MPLPRTDLAIEATQLLNEQQTGKIPGVTVTEDTALTLSSTSLTGIEEVTANDAADKNAVYNLQGVKVANRADALRNLSAGVYVVGGKKVMK